MSNEEGPEDGTSSLTGFPAGTEGTGPLARSGVLALGRFQPGVCVSTMTCDVIQRVASIRGPKHAPSGQGKCILQILERASYQSHSHIRHCQVMTGPHWTGDFFKPQPWKTKKYSVYKSGILFGLCDLSSQSPVESPLPSQKTADTPPLLATLMDFLPQEAVGFGTQFVEIRPDPSPDRDVPLSAQHELSNVVRGTQ